MQDLSALKSKIVTLGRAEYRYDRLVSDFAEHYLALSESGYAPLPDIQVLIAWNRQLNSIIRPELVQAWQAMTAHFGFALGDRVRNTEGELYVVRVSCYPLEEAITFNGFGVGKSGAPSKSPATASAKFGARFERTGECLPQNQLNSLFFEGTSRLQSVRDFLTLHATDA